ncbi:MAG: hypothetical protein ABIR66_01660 [Saprospiraceae bacterium]
MKFYLLEPWGRLCEFKVKDKLNEIHKTLKTGEEQLPPQAFTRINQSFILWLLIIYKKMIPIADSFRPAFISYIKRV